MVALPEYRKSPAGENGGPAENTLCDQLSGERYLLCALLWADTSRSLPILAQLEADDCAEAGHQAILAAIRTTAEAGRSGSVVVFDELQRTGKLAGRAGKLIADALANAVLVGADPLALPALLAAVLADSFRRQVESHGVAIAGAADSLPEVDLWPMVLAGGSRLRGIHERLIAARMVTG